MQKEAREQTKLTDKPQICQDIKFEYYVQFFNNMD